MQKVGDWMEDRNVDLAKPNDEVNLIMGLTAQ